MSLSSFVFVPFLGSWNLLKSLGISWNLLESLGITTGVTQDDDLEMNAWPDTHYLGRKKLGLPGSAFLHRHHIVIQWSDVTGKGIATRTDSVI